jgi:hypothetical protein
MDPVARQNFEKQVNVALVVGISSYPQGSGVTPLNYAARDADVLGAVLESQGYLVRKLIDSGATRGVIRRALGDLSGVVSPEGTILFFFAGHGFADQETKVNYLVPFGVTVDELKEQGLAVTEVEALLLASKAKRKVLFVDACRNVPRGRSTDQRSFEKLQTSECFRELFSTKEGQRSYEYDDLQQGVFTFFLAKGLKGEAAGVDGLVTFHDLADFVTDRMRADTVKRGQVQIPFEGGGESSGDFLLSVGTKGSQFHVPSDSAAALALDLDLERYNATKGSNRPPTDSTTNPPSQPSNPEVFWALKIPGTDRRIRVYTTALSPDAQADVILYLRDNLGAFQTDGEKFHPDELLRFTASVTDERTDRCFSAKVAILRYRFEKLTGSDHSVGPSGESHVARGIGCIGNDPTDAVRAAVKDAVAHLRIEY